MKRMPPMNNIMLFNSYTGRAFLQITTLSFNCHFLTLTGWTMKRFFKEKSLKRQTGTNNARNKNQGYYSRGWA